MKKMYSAPASQASTGESRKKVGRLHVLTDFHFQQRLSHAELAQRAIAGGADAVQFRQKQGAIRHHLHSAARVADVCRDSGVPMIVNDRLDLALAVGADGVHLGQEDMPVRTAREVLQRSVLVGATATTVDQARRAEDEGADYIGFGPVFPTSSKDNPATVKGLEGLAEVVEAVDIPVIGIAGITAERVRAVMEAGAYGVAVMTAITVHPDPESATAHFARAIADFAETH